MDLRISAEIGAREGIVTPGAPSVVSMTCMGSIASSLSFLSIVILLRGVCDFRITDDGV